MLGYNFRYHMGAYKVAESTVRAARESLIQAIEHATKNDPSEIMDLRCIWPVGSIEFFNSHLQDLYRAGKNIDECQKHIRRLRIPKDGIEYVLKDYYKAMLVAWNRVAGRHQLALCEAFKKRPDASKFLLGFEATWKSSDYAKFRPLTKVAYTALKPKLKAKK